MTLRIFIDRGGTFTDCLVLDTSQRPPIEHVMKVLSNEDSAVECIARAVAWLNLGRPAALPSDWRFDPAAVVDTRRVSEVRIGTTIATNALLERRGIPFVFVTTKGFSDLMRIQTQARPDIFDLACEAPAPLHAATLEVDERVAPERIAFSSEPSSDSNAAQTNPSDESMPMTVLKPLPSDETIRALLAPHLAKGIEAVAICFLHAALYPHHESRVAQIARDMGFKFVASSHESSSMVRVVPRANTTCADAYLTPGISRFVSDLFRRLSRTEDHKLRVLFMRSDGGLEDHTSFSGHRAILSGPAGGVVGYAQATTSVLGASSNAPVVGFDMGGTSTDVSRYDPSNGGRFEHVFESETAGVTVQAPQLAIKTVAAGGGSKLWYHNGLYMVGPESVGAVPGPACYRRLASGQVEDNFAITDANLILGRLVPSEFPRLFGPSGRDPISVEASLRVCRNLMEKHGLTSTPERLAMAFVRVANEQMCRPIRDITSMRGYESSQHVLASFGGAGGQHAVAVARLLGMKRVVVHRLAGILSAVGLALARVSHEEQVPGASEELTEASFFKFTSLLDQLVEKAKTKLELQSSSTAAFLATQYLHVRYAGTETALPLIVSRSSSARSVDEDFRSTHAREFGFSLDLARPLLVEQIRVRVEIQQETIELATSSSALSESEPSTRAPPRRGGEPHRAFFERTGWVETPVYACEACAGLTLSGPCLLLQGTSTIVVDPDARARVLLSGDVVIDLLEPPTSIGAAPGLKEDASVRLTLYSHRFMSIAEEMGRTLRRTAVSVNIKERLDYSCALFAPDGGLVAHAPYIPVHLGSMSSAVRAQIEMIRSGSIPPVRPGDVLVSNHPTLAGGSHLPDITVISPAFSGNEIAFWVASRGHHADIGGSRPGSMPPDSTRLSQEGCALVSFRLVEAGAFRETAVATLLREAGSRNVADSLSDLKAQVAANSRGVAMVQSLCEEQSLGVVHEMMEAIRAHCQRTVREFLFEAFDRLGSTRLFAEDVMDDGSLIRLTVTKKEGVGAVFDFEGTGLQVNGNWNAPPSVTKSAVVYCLRSLLQQDVPLNEGSLQAVEIRLPKGSLLDPSPAAAVVGGNVLTSQRLCDVILKAFQACAASQGCMNNLTLGNAAFGYYETIAGGAGAGPTWSGRSGVHTHMTNTRIGDPEIIEMRYPLLIRRFGIRPDSGGLGRHPGGHGLIREMEFRTSLQVSILSERRSVRPFGLMGGGPGACGANTWISTAEDSRAINVGSKASFDVRPGDVLRIETPGGGGWGAPMLAGSSKL